MNKILTPCLAVALTAVIAAACGGGNTEPVPANSSSSGTSQTLQINGAGATFPYPIYSKWFSEYNTLHPNIRVNYQSIGSGGGIQQVINQTDR
jgi:phosphate transport system substrate-binding protein